MRDKLYNLMNWPKIEGIIYGEESKCSTILGRQYMGRNTVFQLFYPNAKSVLLILDSDAKKYEMLQQDEAGYFAYMFPKKILGNYYYLVEDEHGIIHKRYDFYEQYPIISKEDIALFHAGIHYEIYKILGAHPMSVQNIDGIHFSVWAPNATSISVVGDFNNWDRLIDPMEKTYESGIFECFIPYAKPYDNYKFSIMTAGDVVTLKADPYACLQQLRPDSASVVYEFPKFCWEDDAYISKREMQNVLHEPMSLFELHLGSFAQTEDGTYLNYRVLAKKVIDYVKEVGYTHVELMPILEHPLDESWGYQVIGYYAPTSRYGTPEDFMFFVNELHKENIGIILDWVPAHFPKDIYGLSNFDGTCLYEHLDKRQGEHPHWGTLIYNYGREEVSNYLIANALYWIEQFHVDGIRVDAVASMLYLDYGKQDGEWIANIYGGNENLEAIEFLKHLNSIIKKRGRGAISIAEESTAWPKITGDLNDEGLGFDLKWNMGFMNDYLNYISYDPYFRSHHHSELTFSMIYAYSEHFMLVFSHDEVVHGKSSLIGKMPGEIEDKFANLRASYGYFYTHPGKKLLFMGQDIGEFDEWNEKRSIQWNLLEYPLHKGLQELVKDLNLLYKSKKALHELDHYPEGFEWNNCINNNDCVISYTRKGRFIKDSLLVVINFSNVMIEDHRIGVVFEGRYKEVLNSNDVKYGGSYKTKDLLLETQEIEFDGRENSIAITLQPLAIQIYEFIPFSEEELLERAFAKAEKIRIKLEEEAKRKATLLKTQLLKDSIQEKVIEADISFLEGTQHQKKAERKVKNKK
ncbi:MAG: 1,4-alpha-glucan branching protein GlgB [Lachnospiraceae bacterium]